MDRTTRKRCSQSRRFRDPHLARRLDFLSQEHPRFNGGLIGQFYLLGAAHFYHRFVFTGSWDMRKHSWRLANAGLRWLAQLEDGNS